MIAGRFEATSGGRLPVVTGVLALASHGVSGDVTFLIDTGAGSTVLGTLSIDFLLRILVPRSDPERSALARIPSVLGRDVLARFALFLEERTARVLLLEPEEADRLPLPA